MEITKSRPNDKITVGDGFWLSFDIYKNESEFNIVRMEMSKNRKKGKKIAYMRIPFAMAEEIGLELIGKGEL